VIDAEKPRQAVVVSIQGAIEKFSGEYLNEVLTKVNDHVVRVSVMTKPYFWHRHPETDETFLVIEGRLGIEFEDHEVVLEAGEITTVPRGIAHRTRPIGGRSVNLTVEHRAASAEKVDM
jgi:mannose-6-phosphate isomerase-like protein (cupin superfamily)